LSSAILFLAIIAIWACALVPRWLRRSHEASSEPEAHVGQVSTEERAQASNPADYTAVGEPDTSAADYLHPPLAYEADADPAAYPDPQAWPDSPAWSDYTAPAGVGARHEYYRPDRYAPPRLPAPTAGRARALKARRRMLTMLVTLAFAAVACVLSRLTHWWTAIPPVGMLLAYLLLLREAARADAEARRRAEAYARAQATRYRAWEARVRTARPPEPSAEVIDLSDRTADGTQPYGQEAGDQLYDQYADATVRAVGD
jgi:hypothetical protein